MREAGEGHIRTRAHAHVTGTLVTAAKIGLFPYDWSPPAAVPSTIDQR